MEYLFMRRSQVRFSLRSLLLVIFLCAVGASLFRTAMNRFRDEDAILDRLGSTGGKVYRTPRQPAWLWERFGDDIAKKGASLILSNSDVGDPELAEIAHLTALGGLYLDGTRVTDKGLGNIQGMTELVALSLRRTSI